MREMLERVFGEGGAVMAQFIITLVVILALIALVYWLVGHFSSVRLNSASRGRVPRLAILDALPVDSRRKLVLIRRDNVEHLLLIGGPADLVVESSIARTAPAGNRPRQSPLPAAKAQERQNSSMPSANPPHPAAAPAATPVPPQRRNETSGVSEPIPFPPSQRPSVARPTPQRPEPASGESEQARQPAATPRRQPPQALVSATEAVPEAAPNERPASASARFEETAKPARIDSVLSLADTPDDITAESAERNAAGSAGSSTPRIHAAAVEAKTAAPSVAVKDNPSPESPVSDAQVAASGEETPQEKDASGNPKVSDLEKEMARLLGEITSKREG